MDLFLNFVFLFLIFVNDIPSCSMNSFNTRTEYYQIYNKHKNIEECAIKVIGKNEFIGCQLNEETEICEELLRSWDANQTMAKGFSYAIKLSVKLEYHPEHVLEPYGYEMWTIPAAYHEGLNVTIGLPVNTANGPTFILTDTGATEGGLNSIIFQMSLYIRKYQMEYCVDFDHCKISFSAWENSTLRVSVYRIDSLRNEICTTYKDHYVPGLGDVKYILVRNIGEELPIDSIEFSSK